HRRRLHEVRRREAGARPRAARGPRVREPRRAQTGHEEELMSIEINNESGVEVDEVGLVRLAAYALDFLHVHPDADLAIVLVDEAAMEQLHVQWMDEPGPT